MRGYLLSTVEGCLVSTTNTSTFFPSEGIFNKFVKFSAMLCGVFGDQLTIQYQWGQYNCFSARVANTSFYVTILFCQDNINRGPKFSDVESKISKYIAEVILYFFSFPFINMELVRISQSIQTKCFDNLEHGNKVTDINSDINDVILDEIDDTRTLLENFEEHYIYALLQTPAKVSSRLTLPDTEVDDIPESDFITEWYQPLVPVLIKYSGWNISSYICIEECPGGGERAKKPTSVSAFYVPTPVLVSLRRECDGEFYGYLLCNTTTVPKVSVVTLMRCGVELPDSADSSNIWSYVRSIHFVDYTVANSEDKGISGVLSDVVLRDINTRCSRSARVVAAPGEDHCTPNTVSPPQSPHPGEGHVGRGRDQDRSGRSSPTGPGTAVFDSFILAYRSVLRNVYTTFPLGLDKLPPFYSSLPLPNLCPVIFIAPPASEEVAAETHPNVLTFDGNAARCFEFHTQTPEAAAAAAVPVSVVKKKAVAVAALADMGGGLDNGEPDADPLEDSNTSALLSVHSSPSKDSVRSPSQSRDELETSAGDYDLAATAVALQYSSEPQPELTESLTTTPVDARTTSGKDWGSPKGNDLSSGVKSLLSNTFFKTPSKNKVHALPTDPTSLARQAKDTGTGTGTNTGDNELVMSNFPSPASTQVPQSSSKPVHSVTNTPHATDGRVNLGSISKAGAVQATSGSLLTPMPPKPLLGPRPRGSTVAPGGEEGSLEGSLSMSHSASFHRRSGRSLLPALPLGNSTNTSNATPIVVPAAPATAPGEKTSSFTNSVTPATPSPIKIPVTNSTPLKVEDL